MAEKEKPLNKLVLKWGKADNRIQVRVGGDEYEINFRKGLIDKNGEVIVYFDENHPQPFDAMLDEIQKQINKTTDRFVNTLADKISEEREKGLGE